MRSVEYLSRATKEIAVPDYPDLALQHWLAKLTVGTRGLLTVARVQDELEFIPQNDPDTLALLGAADVPPVFMAKRVAVDSWKVLLHAANLRTRPDSTTSFIMNRMAFIV